MRLETRSDANFINAVEKQAGDGDKEAYDIHLHLICNIVFKTETIHLTTMFGSLSSFRTNTLRGVVLLLPLDRFFALGRWLCIVQRLDSFIGCVLTIQLLKHLEAFFFFDNLLGKQKQAATV